MLSYLGEKSLVDVNTFQVLFHELLTLFLTWSNQTYLQIYWLNLIYLWTQYPGVNVEKMVKI